MLEFESTGILTGYIKQLLESFELPKFKIYTREHEKYFELHNKERYDIIRSRPLELGSNSGSPLSIGYISYLKDGVLQYLVRHTDGTEKWYPLKQASIKRGTSLGPYQYYDRGQSLLNKTHRFQIRNNIYDEYTHEYLGNYLRFLRDFDGVNLMPLYNCFSNRLCPQVDLELKLKAQPPSTPRRSGMGAEKVFETHFSTQDTRYKIYKLPVKLFQDYTIALDCRLPIELCVAVYGAYLDTGKPGSILDALPGKTYLRKNNTLFSQPFLYSPFSFLKDAESSDVLRLAQREEELCLLIKIPRSCNSTIVILEGDYTTWNHCTYKLKNPATTAKSTLQDTRIYASASTIERRFNHCVIPDELLSQEGAVEYITALELLTVNTQTQRPFSPNLIGYLLNNFITGSEFDSYLDIAAIQDITKLNSNTYRPAYEGAWDEELQKLIYRYMIAKKQAIGASWTDILGYVDKEVESNYTAVVPGKGKISMLTTDAYKEE